MLVLAEPKEGCQSSVTYESDVRRPVKAGLFPDFKRPVWWLH